RIGADRPLRYVRLHGDVASPGRRPPDQGARAARTAGRGEDQPGGSPSIGVHPRAARRGGCRRRRRQSLTILSTSGPAVRVIIAWITTPSIRVTNVRAPISTPAPRPAITIPK